VTGVASASRETKLDKKEFLLAKSQELIELHNEFSQYLNIFRGTSLQVKVIFETTKWQDIQRLMKVLELNLNHLIAGKIGNALRCGRLEIFKNN
jgi:isocitrate dehydrogenase kinase/phosphatase